MADIGYVKTLLRGIKDETTRRVLETIFEYTYGNLRLGAPEHQVRAENIQAYFEKSTTATEANEEFSFAHGLTSTPKYAIPMLELDKPGAQIVPLTVARAADNKRVYLRSASTSAPLLFMIE